jgi:poly(hydroxyalkanoate) granule-associated protein
MMGMTSKSKTNDASPADWPLWQPPPGLPEPAREVWLAGLGAFSHAQAEGGKAFQALVRQGMALQTQTQQTAQEHIAEAAQVAAQPWERMSGLSSIFEDRVARALTQLGLPAAQDWAALQARVQALEAALQTVLRPASKAAPAKTAAKQNMARAKAKPHKKTRTPASS